MSTIPIVCTRHEEPVVIAPVVEVLEHRHSHASGRWKVVRGIDTANYHADGRIRLTCPECRYDVQFSGDGFRVYGILKHLEGLGQTEAPLRVVEAMMADRRWRREPTAREWLDSERTLDEQAKHQEWLARLQSVTRVD